MHDSLGLYIHVPFCLSKCPYCDFYSVNPDEGALTAYTDAVCRALSSVEYSSNPVDTVYFGGGTPVLLGEKNLSRILETAEKHFCFTEPEVTIEAYPAAVTASGLTSLRYSGFNRVSFGVQSGVDAELAALGRLHTSAEARQSILDANKAGFQNISADLMLGIPHQDTESLARSIDFLGELPLSHVSAYMLKIEENTAFYKLGASVDDDALSDMYLCAVKKLGGLGFRQYEISNFAKNSAVSRHNLKYWTLGEYLGAGPSAHSFIGGRRFFIPRGLKSFIEAENPMSLAVPDGDGGGFEEYAMLRLRLCEGLHLAEAAEKYGADTEKITKKAKPLIKSGLVKMENGAVSLTPRGFLLSNTVTAALLYEH